MKTLSWTVCLIAACICLVEARYKVRRPPLPPPPPPPPKLMLKKSWPIAHRVSMGNTIHINGNFPPKRMPHKPPNYRIRRPPMFNVQLPNQVWKNQMPVRAPPKNHAVLPQRPPVKEFHSMNKMPEYSPEYRPEPAVLPPTHRGGVDDDKGPIHTIPAPNLSLMDRPYNTGLNSDGTDYQRQQTTDANYKPNLHGPMVPNFELATISTSLSPQRAPTSPAPTQHQYEVTESNDLQKEYHTALPPFLPPNLDVTRLSTLVNPDLQSNELLLSHYPAANIGLIGTDAQFGQANTPMQTNLHSSLHVGFPGTAGQAPYMINQQVPDLHVGHPAPAGPPLSATQLYELLNSFPQKIPDQYQPGQQPQLQQHILQQQLGQFLQPETATGFSQPQMHSFNYNEQDNKEQQQQQQQQQVSFDQDYIAGRVNADYNGEADQAVEAQQDEAAEGEDLGYVGDRTEPLENNIEYEEINNQRGQATYFNKLVNNGGISTQFYSTLPNREAAEKLAALAAAGNVNSQLLDKLRQQQEDAQNDHTIPSNHKDEYEPTANQQSYEQDEQQEYRKQNRQNQQYEQEQEQQLKGYEDQDYQDYDRRQQNRQRASTRVYGDQRPLRIMVPEDDYASNVDQSSNPGREATQKEDYDYESEEGETPVPQSATPFDGRAPYTEPNVEFGSRLNTKTGK